MAMCLRFLKVVDVFLLTALVLSFFSCRNEAEGNKAINYNPAEFHNITPSVFFTRIQSVPYFKGDSLYRATMLKLLSDERFDDLVASLNYFSRFCRDSLEVTTLHTFYRCATRYSHLPSDTILAQTEIAVAGLKKLQQRPELPVALSLQASALSNAGIFDKAIQKHFEAIDMLKSDTSHKKDLYIEIGRAGIDYYHSGNFRKAVTLIDSARNKALEIADTVGYALFTSSRSVLLYNEKRYAEAIQFAAEAVELYKRHFDTVGLAESYNNMALPCMAMEDWKTARQLVTKANLLFAQSRSYRQLSISYANIAHCLLAQNKSDSALLLFGKAYEIAASHRYLNEMRTNLKYLWKTNKALGKFGPALAYLERYGKLKDSVFRLEKEKTIQEIYSKHETEQKEQRIAVLQKDQLLQFHKRRNLLLLLLAIVLASVLTIGFFVTRNRKSRQKLAVQKQLHEAEIKHLTFQMESNVRDLTNYTNLLIQKSKLIEELEEKLTEEHERNRETDTLKTVSTLSHFRIVTETDWLNFKAYFDKAFPGFIPRLLKTHPELTPAELRMFLLIKLNIRSSEVASVLGISIESAKKSRYRLKKKLNLPESDDLVNYIQHVFKM